MDKIKNLDEQIFLETETVKIINEIAETFSGGIYTN